MKDGARTDSYNESIEYDLVGNITYLKRNGGERRWHRDCRAD